MKTFCAIFFHAYPLKADDKVLFKVGEFLFLLCVANSRKKIKELTQKGFRFRSCRGEIWRLM